MGQDRRASSAGLRAAPCGPPQHSRTCGIPCLRDGVPHDTWRDAGPHVRGDHNTTGRSQPA
eukprot:5915557-Prorocentrum_lima.AAC.1